MKNFPIDNRSGIGKKRVKVPSDTINNIYENKLRELIRNEIKLVKEADLEAGEKVLPSKIKLYMGKFTDELTKASLTRKKKIAILFKVIKSLGLNPQELSMYAQKVKKEI